MNTTDSVSDASPSKHTIMLAYGYVCFYAPVSLVTSRIEAVIFRNISPFFVNQKVCYLVQFHLFSGIASVQQGWAGGEGSLAGAATAVVYCECSS